MSPLDIEKVDGVPIAHVNEDIDAANATATQQRLADAIGPDVLSLVVDLSDTRYLDSAGIDMLLRLSDRLDRRRAKLILVIPDASQLRRLATIVGLSEAIAIHPCLPDALKEAAKEQGAAPQPDPGQPTRYSASTTRLPSGEPKMTSEHPYLSIEVTNAPEARTIALIGEADLTGTPEIEAALKEACAGEPGLTVLDLRKLAFIDSSGLHALLKGHQLHRARGQELRIIPGPASIQRLFELTGMSDVLPFCDAEFAFDG
ncbi:MAG TPA: STAS domain-containing protein [Solirubrobacterales bacterium]|jgi:anti-sigma B factor antagonist